MHKFLTMTRVNRLDTSVLPCKFEENNLGGSGKTSNIYMNGAFSDRF